MFCDPRAELALAIHRKTDNGNKIVDFLNDVLDNNIPDVRLTHRLQSARMLTKHGHFPDAERFIKRHANKPTPKPSRREKKELSQFDAALGEVIRAEISPASTAQWLIDVMQGRTPAIETGLDTFKPHHRMSAVREILSRAYDRDYTHTTEADLRVPTQSEAAEATPEDRPDASEQESGESEHPEHPIHPEHPASDEEPIDYVAMAKEIVANLDPSEFEEEPVSDRKPDTSMWDIIMEQPLPVITEEHQRIALARLDEKLERRRLWKETAVKIPTRKDHDNYDDG